METISVIPALAAGSLILIFHNGSTNQVGKGHQYASLFAHYAQNRIFKTLTVAFIAHAQVFLPQSFVLQYPTHDNYWLQLGFCVFGSI